MDSCASSSSPCSLVVEPRPWDTSSSYYRVVASQYAVTVEGYTYGDRDLGTYTWNRVAVDGDTGLGDVAVVQMNWVMDGSEPTLTCTSQRPQILGDFSVALYTQGQADDGKDSYAIDFPAPSSEVTGAPVAVTFSCVMTWTDNASTLQTDIATYFTVAVFSAATNNEFELVAAYPNNGSVSGDDMPSGARIGHSASKMLAVNEFQDISSLLRLKYTGPGLTTGVTIECKPQAGSSITGDGHHERLYETGKDFSRLLGSPLCAVSTASRLPHQRTISAAPMHGSSSVPPAESPPLWMSFRSSVVPFPSQVRSRFPSRAGRPRTLPSTLTGRPRRRRSRARGRSSASPAGCPAALGGASS